MKKKGLEGPTNHSDVCSFNPLVLRYLSPGNGLAHLRFFIRDDRSNRKRRGGSRSRPRGFVLASWPLLPRAALPSCSPCLWGQGWGIR